MVGSSTNRFLPAAFILAILFLSFQLMAGGPKQDTFTQGIPANPVIQAMIDSVSPDSLRSYVEKLVSFHTRHINSDTTSQDTGIGAARRWVKHKFQQSAIAGGGTLQPSFFWFTETACGITGLHANVLATLPGTLPQAQNRYFVVSGHLDSRNVNNCDATISAPGANDDGSGTALSIEMARILSGYSLEASTIFMTVTGEEQGLLGSGAYADWALQNNLRIDGMITNDIVGGIRGCANPTCADSMFIVDSTSVRHFSGGPSNSSSRQFSRYMKMKAEQYVIQPDWMVNLIPALDRPGRGGDHIPFYNNGFAAVRFTEANEFGEGNGSSGHQHNGTDFIQYMNFNYLARVVKANIAGFASAALAPATPGEPLQVNDIGNGTDLQITWQPGNSEPDFAGYRVAWRHPDSLFYQDIIAVGNVQEYTLTGLPAGSPVYISYSAVDTDGNESIFSNEMLATPAVTPVVPQQFDATSKPGSVDLAWLPGNELDLATYIITRQSPDGSTVEYQLAATQNSLSDSNVEPQVLYRYSLRVRDADGNESPETLPLRGQLATHDQGILVVDASRDGPGIPALPTDAVVDGFYDTALTGYRVAGQWDIADSLQNQLALSDADMAPYSTVLLHTDVRLPTHRILEDTVALKKYLQNGGKLLMSGWQLILSLTSNGQEVRTFSPGDFVYDYLGIETALSSGEIDFIGADPVDPGYPDLTVDSLRFPNFGGVLNQMDVLSVFAAGGTTEALYSYRSSLQPPSPFNGLPVALRHTAADPKVILFDLPLYYMREAEAAQAVTLALENLGEQPLGIGDENPAGPQAAREFILEQNYPNPFNPSTRFVYQLASAADVDLSIYNLWGQKIATLVRAKQPAGQHTVEWDGRNAVGEMAASGLYFYRLEAAGSPVSSEAGSRVVTKVRKLLLIR